MIRRDIGDSQADPGIHRFECPGAACMRQAAMDLIERGDGEWGNTAEHDGVGGGRDDELGDLLEVEPGRQGVQPVIPLRQGPA